MKNTESLKISVRERLDAESQALVYSQQVATGAKLAASLMVRTSAADAVTAIAEAEGCKTLVDTEEDWKTVWIYKYPFVRLLIDEMRARQSAERPSPLDVWITGKLFGYSDYEIARFLQDHGYIESALT